MQDPLSINIPTTGVDTAFPLMAEGDYDFQITESAPVPNKRQDGFNWKLKLNSVGVIPSVDGKEIAPNAAVFVTIALQPAPDATDPNGFRRNISEATDAIFAGVVPNGFPNTNNPDLSTGDSFTKENRPSFCKELWESAIGKTVRAHIVIDEYQGVKNNKVKRLKKVVA